MVVWGLTGLFECCVYQVDNKGNHLLVHEESSINVPAIAAAHVIKRYIAQASDELSFEVTTDETVHTPVSLQSLFYYSFTRNSSKASCVGNNFNEA